MTHEKVKTIVEEIIGDNTAIRMPPRPNGIQLEWNSKDWAKVEDVIIALEKKLKKVEYVLRKATSHAIIIPAPKVKLVATDQRSKNAKH